MIDNDDREKSFEDTGPIDIVDHDQVARAISGKLKPTTWLQSPELDRALGLPVRIASETQQHTGSFKYRAALAVAMYLPSEHLLAASSGNFGAALARACAEHGKRCTIVMPERSSKMKIDSVRKHGANVDLIDTARVSRLERVRQLEAETGATVVSAYDDPWVIAGNATLGREIFTAAADADCVVVPVGGGGLSSGIIKARDAMRSIARVVGAEPKLANDAARSLRAGVLVKDTREADTICDGARTLALGQRNFAILRHGMGAIVEVDDATVARAMKLLRDTLKLRVEPTGALAVAAVLAQPDEFAGKKLVCVVSGGNVDDALYTQLVG
jgi:threonine dehydratase